MAIQEHVLLIHWHSLCSNEMCSVKTVDIHVNRQVCYYQELLTLEMNDFTIVVSGYQGHAC